MEFPFIIGDGNGLVATQGQPTECECGTKYMISYATTKGDVVVGLTAYRIQVNRSVFTSKSSKFVTEDLGDLVNPLDLPDDVSAQIAGEPLLAELQKEEQLPTGCYVINSVKLR